MAYPYYGGHGPTLVKTIWALFGVSTVLVALRVLVRLAIVKSGGGWSLVWISLAYALALTSNVLYDHSAHWGLGNHTALVTDAPKLADSLLFEWIAANFVNFSAWFGRLSVAAFILGIQGPTNTKYKYVIIIPMTVLLTLNIITIPMIFTQCDPPAKLWDESLPGHCGGVNRTYYTAIVTGAWGSLNDIILALYPAFLLFGLKIQLRLKLIFCSLMGLGLFAAAANIVRTSRLRRLRVTDDPIYESVPIMMWDAIEMWVIIIAASAAPLWPLVQVVKQRYSGNHSTTGGDTRTGDQMRESPRLPVHLSSESESRNQLMMKPGAIEMRTQWSVDFESMKDDECDDYHPEYMIWGGPYGSSKTEIRSESRCDET